MSKLILLFALGQINDEIFECVQIEWIGTYYLTPPLYQVLNEKEYDLICALRCEHIYCRNIAEYVILKEKLIKAAYWGLYANDEEIKMRCKRILTILLACKECEGEGLKYGPTGQYIIWTCYKCKGTGSEMHFRH